MTLELSWTLITTFPRPTDRWGFFISATRNDRLESERSHSGDS